MIPLHTGFASTQRTARYAPASMGTVLIAFPALTGLDGSEGVAVERWFAAAGPPARLDLARSHAPELRVDRLLRLTGPTDRRRLGRLSLGYGDPRGDLRLRTAVAGAGMAGHPSEVVITSGASQALLLAAAAAGPGRDTAVVAGPGYDGPLRACQAAGLRVLERRSWTPGGELLDLRTLTAVPDPGRIRCVVLNSPHNPSGLVAGVDDLERLARWCAAQGAVLVVDEVALGSLDGGAASATQLPAYADGHIAVCGDVSKALGLGGLRTGWLACANAELTAVAAGLLDVVGLGTAGIAQLLAAIALEQRDRLLPGIRRLARRNRAALGRWVTANGLCWTPPVDGLVAYISLVPACGSAAALAARVLRAGDVAVVPGDLLGAPGGLRIGLGLPARLFDEALAALAGAVAVTAAA